MKSQKERFGGIELGQKVRDKITGFEGIITGYVSYITGCNQVLVVPRVKDDGSLPSPQWFDEQRIEILQLTPIILENGFVSKTASVSKRNRLSQKAFGGFGSCSPRKSFNFFVIEESDEYEDNFVVLPSW